MKVGRKAVDRTGGDGAVATAVRGRAATRGRRPHEPRGNRPGPQTVPAARPADRPSAAKTVGQAKARSKARKAKAPKAIRLPLRDRLIARLATLDLRPRALLTRIPFVVLVIGSLAVGLAITLWLSTDAAQRSYQLGAARALNDALMQQKESLERDVLAAQSAPALADAARDLGMIPSRDTAHLVQDPAGNWVVVGQPKPAEGAPPPPLNTKLPEENPPPPPPPPPAPPVNPVPPVSTGARGEVPMRLPPGLTGVLPGGLPGGIAPEVTVPLPPSVHAPAGAGLPGPADGTAAGGLILLPVQPAAPVPAPAVPDQPVAPLPGPGQ